MWFDAFLFGRPMRKLYITAGPGPAAFAPGTTAPFLGCAGERCACVGDFAPDGTITVAAPRPFGCTFAQLARRPERRKRETSTGRAASAAWRGMTTSLLVW